MSNIYQYTIAHPSPEKSIHIAFGKANGVWDPKKTEVARRLIRAYKATISQTGNPLKEITDKDLWTGITRENFKAMLEFIENDQAEKLARYLSQFGSEYVWFGGITTGVDGYNHWDTSEESIAYSYFDKLVCLAEGLGLLAAENPEQGDGGNWGQNIKHSPDSIADAIAKNLGIEITPPQGIIPVAGIQLRSGLLHYRHINSLYTATRIHQLTDSNGSICEYGGGLGLVAYYLYKLGRTQTTLFDIPITNIFSAYFLIGALGDEAVSLEGEELKSGTIQIRANWNCLHTPDKSFQLTVNQDSFPEINRKIFDEYVRQIKRNTTKYFLSINHEVEHSMAEDANHLNVSRILSSDRSMKRMYRAPYWIRRGYVEELYEMRTT